MTQQPEALLLAECLEEHDYCTFAQMDRAAAKLRRLHKENERLAGEVANRNRRALEGDEAVTALENVHAYYEKLERVNAQLLKALTHALLSTTGWRHRAEKAIAAARREA